MEMTYNVIRSIELGIASDSTNNEMWYDVIFVDDMGE